MAAGAKNTPAKAETNGGLTAPGGKVLTPVQVKAVELYIKGYTRKDVAKTLMRWLAPAQKYIALIESGERKDLKNIRLRAAQRQLKQWEQSRWFRDVLFELALNRLDLEVPAILEGVAKKAKRGRVDAAKLSLSLVDRYEEHKTPQPTQVQIVFGGLPRPPGRTIESRSTAEETIEDAEWTEEAD